MICIIRIRGEVGLNKDIIETLNRLRLRKKYSCVVLNPTKEQLGMLKKIKNFVAWGEISEETLRKLIEKRGQLTAKTKKFDVQKSFEGLMEGKKYEELNLKPFFRLHPPRGGIKSKLHYPKGVLGDHKEKINDLINRML